jgi:hypothetical protein
VVGLLSLLSLFRDPCMPRWCAARFAFDESRRHHPRIDSSQGRVGGVTQGAVNLYCAVDDLPQTVRHEVLGHRYFRSERQTVLDLVRSMEHHQFALVQLHRRIGDQPLDSLLLRQQRSVRETIQRAINHHVEGSLCLADPAHAMCQTCRPQSILAEKMTLTASSEHLGLVHAKILDFDLAVIVPTGHRLHVANDVETLTGDVHDETGVCRLRNLGIIFGSGDQQCKLGTTSTGDEPLVAIDDPFVTVLIGMRTNERRIAARHFGLRHRKA